MQSAPEPLCMEDSSELKVGFTLPIGAAFLLVVFLTGRKSVRTIRLTKDAVFDAYYSERMDLRMALCAECTVLHLI